MAFSRTISQIDKSLGLVTKVFEVLCCPLAFLCLDLDIQLVF